MPAAGLIRELPDRERPRERLLRQGPQALSDGELLAVLLRTGVRGRSVLSLAVELLTERGGLAGLLDCSVPELVRHGLGPAKAATLLAGVELGRRLARTRLSEREPMKRPAEVASYLGMRYGLRDQEVVGALYLDVHGRLIAERELYRGTLTSASAEPRAVLKEGLLLAAESVVLFHTHPSGEPEPSNEDLLFTQRLAEAGRAVGIELADHLILGLGGAWVSLKERGAC